MKLSATVYQEIVAESSDALFLLDRAGRFLDANPAALRLCGLSIQALRKARPADLVEGPDGFDPQDLLRPRAAPIGYSVKFKNNEAIPAQVDLYPKSIADPAENESVLWIARINSSLPAADARWLNIEQQFSALLQNSQPIIYMIDRNGYFTLSEGLGLTTLGLRPGEVVGRSAREMYQNVPKILYGIEKALNGSPHRDVVEVEGLFFDAFYTPLRDSTGEIDGLLGMAVDITESIRALEKITISENKYRALFDAAGDPIFIADAETGYLLDANRSAQELIGRSIDEIRSMHQVELHPPEEGEYYRELFSHHSSIDRALTEPIYVRHKDGFNVPVEVSTTIIELEGRKAVQGIFRNLTERLQFQDQLLIQSSALNAAANAILITDQEGSILFVNPAFTDLTGYSSQDVLGKTPRVLKSGVHGQQFYASLWDTITAGEVWKGNLTNKRKDGSRYICEQTITPVLNRQGEIETFVAIQSDITERIRVEKDLQRRLTESDALKEISIASAASHTEDEIIRTTTELVGKTFYTDHFGVMLIDFSENVLKPHASYIGLGPKDFDAEIPIGKGVSGKVVTTGKPRRIPDVSKAKDFIQSTERMRSELCVPLIVDGKPIGVINVESKLLDAFSLEDEKLLITISGYLATAIERTRLHNELISSKIALEEAYNRTLQGWASALELRDHETRGHTERVTMLTLRLAERMGISGDALTQIKRGSILHDIGKIGIPDSILFKASPLNDREWEVMRRHPIYAYDLLSQIPFLRPALAIPYHHHEHWDGTGYPHRQKGKEIPLEARIFAVVDAWDALSTARPYRPAWSRSDVVEHIKSQSGKQFDPKVVDRFIEMILSDD